MMISYKKTIFWRILLLTILILPGCQRDKITNVAPSEPQKHEFFVPGLPNKQATITDTNNKGLRTAISEKHNSRVSWAVFTPDGKFLVTASHSDPCKVWEVATGREIRHFGNGTYTRIGISPDGNSVAAAQDKHTIKLY
ncbi:MAG: WD40 repeat domain-containing protein, partial [Desulfobacterales bacterium]|nr:WD40 repeat domain-containing protein [Desulfobacterales bacterium]